MLDPASRGILERKKGRIAIRRKRRNDKIKTNNKEVAQKTLKKYSDFPKSALEVYFWEKSMEK